MDKAYRYVRLEKEDAIFFKELDPFDKLSLLSMPYGFSIGVLEDDNDALKTIGLLVGCVSEEVISVEWLVVAPEYRYKGIGEELLLTVFQMADAGDIPELAAPLLPEYEKEVFSHNAKSFFMERLFDKNITIGADAFYQLLELTETDLMKKDKGANASISRFSQMTGAQVRDCIDKLCMIDTATYSYTPDGLLSKLDADLCFVALNGSKPEGAILVAMVENAISPVYYYAKSSELGDELMRLSIKAATEKYGKSFDVMITMRQPEAVIHVEKVLGPQEKCDYLMASVQEFRDMEKE